LKETPLGLSDHASGHHHGLSQITANEPQFTGHFPDRPIMPGVLMVEAMAQLGGTIALQQPISDGKGLFFFAGMRGQASFDTGP